MNRFTPLIPLALMLAVATAMAESVDETRAMNADGRFSLSAVSGQFEIIGSNDDQLRLSGTLGDEISELRINGDPGNWDVELRYKENHRGTGYGTSTQLTLHVPHGAETEVRSVSGDLDLKGLDGQSVDARSVSGDINLSGVTPDRLGAETVSGSLHLDAGGKANRLKSVSGSIDARGLTGRIRAGSVSGGIELSASEFEEIEIETVSGRIVTNAGVTDQSRIAASSHSGSIHLALPAGTPVDIRARSFSGGIESAFGGQVESGRGPGERLEHRVGDGRVRVEVRSFSGNIRLVEKQ